jgi:hypothetical protein
LIEQEHIVKKFAFNVEIGQHEKPEYVRTVLLEKIQNVIQFELAELMDEYALFDETIQIDSLELDLGEVTLDNIDEAVLKSFKKQLEYQLKSRGFNAAHLSANKSNSSGVDNAFSKVKGKFPQVGQFEKDSDQFVNSNIVSNAQRKFEGLLDFLEAGIISWWNPLKSMDEMELFAQELINTKSSSSQQSVINAMQNILRSNRKAKERLAFNFSQEFFVRIVNLISGKNELKLTELIHQTEIICQFLSLDVCSSEARAKIIRLVLLERLLEQPQNLPTISQLTLMTQAKFSASQLNRIKEKDLREKLLNFFFALSTLKSADFENQKLQGIKIIKGLNKKIKLIQAAFHQAKIKLLIPQFEKLLTSLIKDFYEMQPLPFLMESIELKKNEFQKNRKGDKIDIKNSTQNRSSNFDEKAIKEQVGFDKYIPIQPTEQGVESEVESQESLDEKFRKYIDQFKSNAAEIQKEKEQNQPKDNLAKGQSIQSIEKDKLTQKFELLRKKREEKLREESAYLEKMRQENERLESLKEEKIQSETAYFNFAGIVIIWPLIVPLFDDRQLLENRNFKDEEARFKGLQMLNYLVNGDEVVEEKDMPLNKILCGIPRNESVLFTSELSNDDKLELNALLAHLIKHWSILKNTSIQGLRDGFIHRKGQIAENEIEWSLKVEQKSIDLLMNSMPWGYKMIKLPWMNKLLVVEW